MTTPSAVERPTRTVSRRTVWSARLGYIVLRILGATWRVRPVNDAPWRAIRERGATHLFALWHSDLLALTWVHRSTGAVVMVSEHGDGEIIARIMEWLRFGSVRGSSSRDGSRALLRMIRLVEAGAQGAFTPDGPRGPRHSWQPGILAAASRAQVPIVCIGVAVNRAWRLNSWDRFVIPKPFATIHVAYANPEWVAEKHDVAKETERFQAIMDEAERQAEAALARG